MRKGDVAFAVASSFLVGVAARSFGVNSFLVLFAAFAFIVVWRFVPVRFGSVSPGFGVLILCALIFGMWYLEFYVKNATASNIIPIGTATEFSGIVAEEPKIFEKAVVFPVTLALPNSGTLTVISDPFFPVRYGDSVSGKGNIGAPPYGGAPPEAAFPDVRVVGHASGMEVKGWLIGLKGDLVRVLKKSLPKDLSALMAGITLGVRSDFTSEFKAQMSASGTTHLVALSGYNISILVLGIGGALGRYLRKRTTFFITLAIIALFVAMVGSEASVVRAALMGVLVLLAKELGRQQSMRNAITLTAAGMVFVTPTILAHDLGFILSFVSLLGLVCLEKPLGVCLCFNPETKGMFREEFLTTLSAQLAVAPILALAFGSVSLTAIFANVLVLSIVPLVMCLGFFLSLVGLWFTALSQILAWVVAVPLGYMRAVIAVTASLRIPIEGLWSSSFVVIGYYCLLVLLYYYGTRPRAALPSPDA